jgi:hypothetical protein
MIFIGGEVVGWWDTFAVPWRAALMLSRKRKTNHLTT